MCRGGNFESILFQENTSFVPQMVLKSGMWENDVRIVPVSQEKICQCNVVPAAVRDVMHEQCSRFILDSAEGCSHIQAYLGATAGLIPDRHNKAKLTRKPVTQFFWFPSAYKGMFTLCKK